MNRLQTEFSININTLKNAVKWISGEHVCYKPFNHRFLCELCHQTFDTKEELKFHQRIPHINNCDYCTLRFTEYFNLVRHYWIQHSGVKFFI